ncbi:MAG: protein kinase [Patescibacteria group bacterium]
MSKETRIHFLGDHKINDDNHGVQWDFLNDEKGIGKKALDAYVRHILEVIDEIRAINSSPSERKIFVLETLREDSLIEIFTLSNDLEYKEDGNYCRPGTDECIAAEEMKKAISDIRRAVIKKLADHLDPDDYYLVVEDLQNKYDDANSGRNDVVLIENQHDRDSEPSKIFRTNEFVTRGRYSDSMQTAFSKLTTIPPHKNIVNIYHQDKEKAVTIAEYLGKIKNVQELLRSANDREAVKRILKMIHDGVQGAIHLHRQGIILMDICSENIGCVKTKDNEKNEEKGVLFDLEACAIDGTKTKRFAHINYSPPECASSATLNPNISEKEPVYQFGVILEELDDRLIYLRKKRIELSPEFEMELTDLLKTSLNREPKNRPTLTTLSVGLEHLISLI